MTTAFIYISSKRAWSVDVKLYSTCPSAQDSYAGVEAVVSVDSVDEVSVDSEVADVVLSVVAVSCAVVAGDKVVAAREKKYTIKINFSFLKCNCSEIRNNWYGIEVD